MPDDLSQDKRNNSPGRSDTFPEQPTANNSGYAPAFPDAKQSLPVITVGTLLIEKYRLETRISQGQSGEVWKAYDKAGDRPVALKFVLRDIPPNPEELAHVKATFQAVHQLNHQYICPVYALEEDPVFGYFIVMKWLEGRTLRDIHRLNARDDGRLPVQLVPQLLQCVADALDYAHKKGVVHGDVKPTNISVLVKDSKISDISLIDFGLAGEVRENLLNAAKTDTSLTGENGTGNSGWAMSGFGDTIAFISPEVWRGASQNARTDQYSLAVIAYELYSGHLPFFGSTLNELRDAILTGHPDPIPGIPDQINRALAKALSKNSSERFKNCSEFIRSVKQPLSRQSSPSGTFPASSGTGRIRTDGPSSTNFPIQSKTNGGLTSSFLLRYFKSLFSSVPQQGIDLPSVWLGRILIVLFLLVTISGIWLMTHLYKNELPPENVANHTEVTDSSVAISPVEKDPPSAPSDLPVPSDSKQPPSTAAGIKTPVTIEPGTAPGQRKVLTIDNVEYPFRWCPPGHFSMGSPDSEPNRDPEETLHEVTLSKGFWILETEVTQEMYRNILGTSTPGGETNIDSIPAHTVSWKEIMEFCHYFQLKANIRKATVTIPSEAQWEYAARAGAKTPFAGTNSLDNMGWFVDNSGNRKRAVRMKTPNTWGIFDMHGGIREWCNDWYAPYSGTPVTDPVLPPDSDKVVIRGGGYRSPAAECRSARRDKALPGTYVLDLGFRIALLFPNGKETDGTTLFVPPTETLYMRTQAHFDDNKDQINKTKSDLIATGATSESDVNKKIPIPDDDKPLSLDLSRVILNDTLIQQLKNVHRLRSLNLKGGVLLTDQGLDALTGLAELQMLNLEGCRRLTNDGLARLTSLRQLRVLNLTDCRGITDRGLASFRELNYLQWLYLNHTQTGDAGLVYLQELPFLQRIELQGCVRITDAGLKLLATFPQLTEINLSNCPQITDTGFEQLKKLSQLKKVTISGCDQITNVAAEELAGSIPGCQIER